MFKDPCKEITIRNPKTVGSSAFKLGFVISFVGFRVCGQGLRVEAFRSMFFLSLGFRVLGG